MFSNYSPNMLKTYDNCAKKFYYQYIENLRVPQDASKFEKGKKIHALANYFLQGVNISRIETALSAEELNVWNLLLENPFFRKDYYRSEYQISCKINKYWIGGRLDAVVRDFDDYYILDYKTGSIPANFQYDYQTMIYLLCLDKILKSDYHTLSFVYINLKEKNNCVVKFNDILRVEYEKKIVDMCSKIELDRVYNPNISKCSMCEYKRLCMSEF